MLSLSVDIWRPVVSGGRATVGPITLFDTTAGDAFTDLNWSGTDAGLTVTASKVTQNTAAVLNINASVKRAGSTILHAVDCWTVDAVVKLKSWPATARGLYVGSKNTQGNNHFAAHVLDAGAVTFAFSRMTINGGDLYNYPGGYSLAGQPVTTIKMQRSGADVHSVVNYAAAGDRPLDGALVFAATSYELPRMFNDWCLNFGSGDLEVTSLKVTAEYANARFAFLGDSLTQGRFATNYADGFAAKIRADYPGDVLISGAPSAVSADWVTNIEGIKMMTPRRVFIMMGTNDIGMGVSLATYQTNMTAIIAALEAAGASVVLVSIPPRGYSPARTDWNPWLAGLGKPFIDVYTPLATGDALNATYNSGDNVHMNTAGHAVVYDTIKAAIVANGW